LRTLKLDLTLSVSFGPSAGFCPHGFSQHQIANAGVLGEDSDMSMFDTKFWHLNDSLHDLMTMTMLYLLKSAKKQ
jgi:hypothetical protein